MSTALSLATKFTAIDNFTSKVDKMSLATNKFSKSASGGFASIERAGRRMGQGLNKVSSTVKNLATAGAALAIGGGVAAGADAFLDLDKNMGAAAAKFGIFSREDKMFKELRNRAIELGASTEFTSGQVAEGLKNMATGGFTAEQAIASINKQLDLATATQSELGLATDVSAKSLAAFGLKSKDPAILNKNLDVVNDTLNKIITTSGFGDLEQFLDVIAMSGSSARAAGVDIKTWGSVVAGTVSEAVPASVAGTRFANMLSFMTKKTAKFNKIGVKLKDETTGGFRDFFDIMTDIDKATKGMDKFDKQGKLLELFGERGSKMATSILENGVPALRDYREQLNKADKENVTGKMAKFMRGGLAGQLAAMKSGFEAIAISIGDAFAPEIEGAIKSLTTIARNTKSWVQENKTLLKVIFEVGIFIAQFAIAMKAITLAITLYRNAVIIAKVVQWAWNAAMMANPIGLIIAAIVLLIGYVTLMVTKWDEWGAALVFLNIPIGMIISVIMSLYKNWQKIKDAFRTEGMVAGLKMLGATLLDAILKPVQQVLELMTRIPIIGSKIAPAIDKIKGFRESMGVNMEGEVSQAVNPDATAEKVRTERSEKITNNNIQLDINDMTGGAAVKSNAANIPINLTTSMGWQ